jgi:hypothetical protein
MSHDKSTLVPHAPQASRRALLMGLAAAATPIAPALANAMGGLPTGPAGVDPNTGRDDPRKQIAQDFPLRLAATLRTLIGEALS